MSLGALNSIVFSDFQIVLFLSFNLGGGIMRFKLFVAGSLLCIGAFFAWRSLQEPTTRLRWVVAHGPKFIVEAGAKEFQNQLDQRAPGKFKVNFDFPSIADVKEQEIYLLKQMNKVQNGELEILQVYSNFLGRFNSEFQVLDIPFLFDSHAHAFSFMDGELGGRLLASLENIGLKGLAFTYSGGYRVIATSGKEITEARDLAGMKVSYNGSKNHTVFKETYSILGAEGISVRKGQVLDKLASGEIDAFETVYPRILNDNEEFRTVKVVNETNHSMHMTVVIMNRKFYSNLSSEMQKIVSESAQRAAQFERHLTLERTEVAKKMLAQKGVKIVEMTSDKRKAMAAQFHDFSSRFPSLFEPAFAEAIRNLPVKSEVAGF